METPQKQQRKPTLRQRAAAKAVIENLQVDNPQTMAAILEKSGYSPKTALTPKTATDTPGFKQALYDLGLTEELITSSLVEDIKLKPQQRIQELKLGAELLGMVKREDEQIRNTNNTYNFLFSADVQANIRAIDNKIKEQLINHESLSKD